jgi:hypothetical protein
MVLAPSAWFSRVSTTSFISIDPAVDGFNFVVGERDGERALIIRDAQHEYAFVESAFP